MMTLAACYLVLQKEDVQAPILKGFKLGARKVAELPDNGGYQVFQKDGKIQVLTRVEYVRQDRARKPKSNPAGTVVLREKQFGASLVPGEGAKVTGGELFAVDVGEWGGGIYFVRNQKKPAIAVSRQNTQAIRAFGTDIYAFQSLNHLQFWYADLVRLKYENEKWSVETVKKFTEAPNEVESESDRFILLMRDEVLALYPDGHQMTLANKQTLSERYWCMTVLPNRQIWLGSNSGVMALVPAKNGTYQAFKYIPK